MYGTGLNDKAKITSGTTALTATGTTAVNGGILDMLGFEGAIVDVVFGSAAVDNGVKWQQGSAANMSDAADLAGTSIVGNTRVVSAQVHKPTKRYVRAVVVRGTTSTVESMVYRQYGAKTLPVTHATTVTTESNVSPAEGTA